MILVSLPLGFCPCMSLDPCLLLSQLFVLSHPSLDLPLPVSVSSPRPPFLPLLLWASPFSQPGPNGVLGLPWALPCPFQRQKGGIWGIPELVGEAGQGL